VVTSLKTTSVDPLNSLLHTDEDGTFEPKPETPSTPTFSPSAKQDPEDQPVPTSPPQEGEAEEDDLIDIRASTGSVESDLLSPSSSVKGNYYFHTSKRYEEDVITPSSVASTPTITITPLQESPPDFKKESPPTVKKEHHVSTTHHVPPMPFGNFNVTPEDLVAIVEYITASSLWEEFSRYERAHQLSVCVVAAYLCGYFGVPFVSFKSIVYAYVY
jgi:hypothetical protein